MTQPDISLRRIDHLRFFVGNARQSAYFYRNAFGFDVVAYAGLETKVKHESGYVLRQGQITFVLTSPLSEQHPESQRLIKHGDGVMDKETVFLEGMFHAALHLQKIRHAQSLAIGASPAQQAATGPDTDGPSATPFIRLIEVAQHYDAPGPDVAVASNRGRAPPTSPT